MFQSFFYMFQKEQKQKKKRSPIFSYRPTATISFTITNDN